MSDDFKQLADEYRGITFRDSHDVRFLKLSNALFHEMTIDNFQQWLTKMSHKKGESHIIGIPRKCNACPLTSFINSLLGDGYHGLVNDTSFGFNGYSFLLLPPWAKTFINIIDGMPHDHILVETAMRVVEDIKQRA